MGDLLLRDKERIQPRAGRLDLLLQDPETERRYEVEIQLGSTDEAHIIRTLEYWDIERKRYPQYDHCAVIVAEDITSRFLNVISLFNGTIPLIAIQMQAVTVGDVMTVVFTKVMDELVRGVVDEDEVEAAAPADRSFWETRASRQTVALADDCLTIARDSDPTLELKYNRHYIGISRNGKAMNFIAMCPRKSSITIEVRLPKNSETDATIEAAGIELLGYARWGAYKLSVPSIDFLNRRDVLSQLIKAAYDYRTS